MKLDLFLICVGMVIVATIWALWKPTIQPWLAGLWATIKAKVGL